MRLGEPKSAKSSWPGHEATDRYEPVPAPGAPANQRRLRSETLVDAWKGQRVGHRVMAFAKANVVLTHDLDFGAILAATHGEKPSVVQIRSEDVSPDVIGKPVMVALRQMAAELEEGALLTLDPNHPRLRVLPLPSRE
jgi:predicted nuclease of predicted toxin-antitoxin system